MGMWMIGGAVKIAIVLLPKFFELLIGSQQPEYRDEITELVLHQMIRRNSTQLLILLNLDPQLLAIGRKLDPAVAVGAQKGVAIHCCQGFR